MNAELNPLWKRISDFAFDLPDARLPFSRRLARENGWTPAYTRRVLDEYRRFLFLAMTAPHPVTPSDAVDEAWHLHLLYTESYWEDLCRDTLGRPLHHGPTKGGTAEDARFEDQYARTLAAYRAWFGQEAPGDIWPGVAEQFAPDKARRLRKVDASHHWVVPKPRLRPVAWRSVGAAAAVLVAGLLLTGAGGKKGGGGLGTLLGIGAAILIVAFGSAFKGAGAGGTRNRRGGGSGGSSGGGGGGAFFASCGSDSTHGDGGDGGGGDSGGDGGGSGCGSSGCGGGGCGGGGCGS